MMSEKSCLVLDAEDNAINVVVIDEHLGPPTFLIPSGGRVILNYDGPWVPGAHYDGTTVEMPPESDPPPRVVTRVTAAQAKLALYGAGLLDQVTSAAASYPPMKIFYENSPYWDVDHPYVRGLATELGLSDEQIGALFTQASSL